MILTRFLDQGYIAYTQRKTEYLWGAVFRICCVCKEHRYHTQVASREIAVLDQQAERPLQIYLLPVAKPDIYYPLDNSVWREPQFGVLPLLPNLELPVHYPRPVFERQSQEYQ